MTARLSAQGDAVTQTVTVGTKITFTASATAYPAPLFQWNKNGTPIAGATGDTLRFDSVTLADAGSYTVLASNIAGAALSPEAVLVVDTLTSSHVAPAFTTHPASATADVASTVTFSAAASGTPAPTFQWLRNGVALAGQTGTTLTLSNLTTNDAGTYAVVATNSAGSATSQGASLTVNSVTWADTSPAFVVHPSNVTAEPSSTVTFTAVATGTPAPSFRWYRNGSTFAGWTGATLTLPALTTNDIGSYFVVATNTAGSATSNQATLTLGTLPPSDTTAVAPVITTQPASITADPLSSVTFTAAASGTPAPTYQWLKNGVAVSGWTAATLTLEAVTNNDAATYVVVATNVAGSATSKKAALTINKTASTNVPPVITTAPTSQTVASNSNVLFSAAASGTPAPTFQWWKNGDIVAGATNATLGINNVTSSHAGSYWVVATNVAGSARSPDAVLTVTAPPLPNTAPVFTVQPASQTAVTKADVTFRAAASGSPAPAYQWKRDNLAIPGATNASLTLNNISLWSAGTYTVVATNSAGAVTSTGAVLTVVNGTIGKNTGASTTFAKATIAEGDDLSPVESADVRDTQGHSRLTNLSVRSAAGIGSDSLIVGFVVSGDATKSLLVRGIGPALASFGVAGSLQDPMLSLYSGSVLVGSNDNWSSADDSSSIAAAAARVGAFNLPNSSRDAVLLTSLAAGGYTAQVTGAQASTGVALVELYDTNASSAARLINVSVRTFVGSAGSEPVIGFVIDGTGPKQLLVRAIGPALATFGVSGLLGDPQLELYQGSTSLQRNDNWGGGAALTEAFTRVGAFPITAADSKDAAILFTAAPGPYTAVVSGVSNTTGTVIVEVYEVP